MCPRQVKSCGLRNVLFNVTALPTFKSNDLENPLATQGYREFETGLVYPVDQEQKRRREGFLLCYKGNVSRETYLKIPYFVVSKLLILKPLKSTPLRMWTTPLSIPLRIEEKTKA